MPDSGDTMGSKKGLRKAYAKARRDPHFDRNLREVRLALAEMDRKRKGEE